MERHINLQAMKSKTSKILSFSAAPLRKASAIPHLHPDIKSRQT
jgi:hypothetical protein